MPIAGKAKNKGSEQLICGSGLNDDGTIAPPPDPHAINSSLLPANKSVWASLIPALVPEHYHGGLTVADPTKMSESANTKKAARSRSKKTSQTINDRAKPEAPIADEIEVAMLWDRVSALTAPRWETSSGNATPRVSVPTTPVSKGLVTPRNTSKSSQQSPISARSNPLVGQSEEPLPYAKGQPSESSMSSPQSPEIQRRDVPSKGRGRGSNPPETPLPQELQVFNTQGIFEGSTATGGIYTLSYPGIVTATSVQPPTTIVASRSTAKSSANNQTQQPYLGSTYVTPSKPSDRPIFATNKNDGKAPQIGPEMVANYGNVNSGASDVNDKLFYTYSYPHAVAAGPHTGALMVPIEVPSGMNRKGAELSAPGVFINMISPTVPRLMSDEMVADRPVKIGNSGLNPTSASPRRGSEDFGAKSRHIPRPPIRAQQDGSRPERTTAAFRNKTAEWNLKVAQEALSESTERKVGHTLLILYEREQAKRERVTIEKRIEDLTAIYNKATEAHRSNYSAAQQQFDTEIYQRHNALNEALQSQPYAEECIADEAATTASLKKAEQQLIDEIREHGIALKSLAQSHLQERAQLMATMTNKLKRTFGEMKTVTATQRADRLGRAHTEATRLGKELAELDKTNRALTGKLTSIKSGIAAAQRDLDLEQQRHKMLQTKFNKLSSKVAASVSDLRSWEKGLLIPTDNEAPDGFEGMPSLADALEQERIAIATLQQHLAATSEERLVHERATAALRGTLMERLQWGTKTPAPYDVVQGLTQMLTKESKFPIGAPEPDIETQPTKETPMAPTQGLLTIGAIIQEALDEVMAAITKQQSEAPQLTDASDFSKESPRHNTELLPSSTGGSRRSQGSTLALPQLRYSSSAFVFREVEGSIQILSLEPPATPNHVSMGSGTGEVTPKPISTAGEPSFGSPLDISSMPGTPRGGARHVRISEQWVNAWPVSQRPAIIKSSQVQMPVATVGYPFVEGTSVAAVRSLLDIADPTEKRLIQDFIVKRINRKLSQVLPTAPPVLPRRTNPSM